MFDLCCNRGFMSMIRKASCALNMTSNGGGLKITKQGKFPGYTFWVWFSKQAITNIICLKNLIKIYRVTYDSEVATTFIVHCQQFGLPDLFFKMHPCGLHICYPKKMGEFGFIQTVMGNMKLFSKRQTGSATQAKDLFAKMIFPFTEDFRAIVSAGGVPGSDVTLQDVMAAKVIWGHSILNMKGNMVRRNGKKVVQSIIKVTTGLIKLHQDVESAIGVFFVNKHIFFTTYSTKIGISMVTHLAYHEKEYFWEDLLVTYNMYLCQGFHITVMSGDQEFSVLNALTTVLPTTPCLDWAAASQHCGLIERTIRFLKEKLCLLRHSLLFMMVPGIMVVCMVLHIIEFVNGFPCQGVVKHFSPGEIMMGCCLQRSTSCYPLESIARSLKTFSHGTVLLHRHELQFWWAVWATFPVIRFSLHLIPATQ
jgi:hypothetical protein